MRSRELSDVASAELRLLASRFANLSDRHLRTVLRLFTVPDLRPDLAKLADGQKGREVQVLWPDSMASAADLPLPIPNGTIDAVVPYGAIKDCPDTIELGNIGVSVGDSEDRRLLYLGFGPEEGKSAALDFLHLASEAGQVTQTLRPDLSPIEFTTSSRNLWCSWMFGMLRSLAWVRSAEGFQAIENPFAASCDLCRFFLYRIDGKGNAFPNTGVSAPVAVEKPNGETKRSAINKRKDERDAWIYQQCVDGIPYQKILGELKRLAKSKGWQIFTSPQRVRQIGAEYATAHGLPLPAARQGNL